ncbi:MAG TPA: TadE/TadG family type IV pilus assembly protein, partial [Actinomycetes bacterium]|nr:TadE/TadG family type IV pilus assembly protein [Actinomycetes bacterium]
MAQRGEDGAAAVEFAFLLPLLVLLLFGFIQFGIALNTRIQATNAAREAARTAVIGIDNWADLGGGVSFWNLVETKAGLGDLANCSLTTDNVVGGNLT